MITFSLASSLLVFVYMTALLLVALARKDNSLADIGWGIGVLLVTALTFWLEAG
jgi:steroid 5-alpha reductase family enzyme